MDLLGFALFFVLGAVGGYMYARRKFNIASGGPKGSGGGGGSQKS